MRTGNSRRSWSELTKGRRIGLVGLAAVQLSLAIAAWADLAARDPREVNGSKRKWAAIIAVNFIGPIAYFRAGISSSTRRRADS
ncbi:MAG: PLDc N-terminal domain-containing protein [Rhodococcus sp. (in: high G+C Gram-positive bacteria)]|uniref:PLDc N-terminal domain-containing protein n=1 Tax=Rhodococcus sp. TaxID=1831 RepID=UPI003BAE4879